MANRSEIVRIYLNRPTSMVGQRLGQWFMNAHNIHGHTSVYNATDYQTILTNFENLGWMTYDVAALQQYNQSGQK